MATFADRLKELRQKTNVKQTVIAELLGVLPRTVRFYESGEREPNIENIKKLADFFNVSTDYLMGRTNYWFDADGNITVKVPPDILNLDTEELKRRLGVEKD